jgi:hypothetical protein
MLMAQPGDEFVLLWIPKLRKQRIKGRKPLLHRHRFIHREKPGGVEKIQGKPGAGSAFAPEAEQAACLGGDRTNEDPGSECDSGVPGHGSQKGGHAKRFLSSFLIRTGKNGCCWPR